MTRPGSGPKTPGMARYPSLAVLILLPLALGACQKGAEQGGGTSRDAGAQVPCALQGAASFKGECSVDRIDARDGLTLLVHHPDGGFRRLLVTTDGRGVVTADGSEQAIVTVIDPGMIEVTVGEDRYRLPATVKGQALPAR